MRGVRRTVASVQQEREVMLLPQSLGVQPPWVVMELKKGINNAYVALFCGSGTVSAAQGITLRSERGSSTEPQVSSFLILSARVIG